MTEPIDRDVVADDIATVDEELAWLAKKPMYFGGSVVPLYVDDPAVLSDAPRPTEDVDLLVSVPGGLSRYSFERELTQRGWVHDQRSHRRNALAFLCAAGIPVDVVLADQPGPSDWVVRALDEPEVVTVSGRPVQIPTPAFLVASKLKAAMDNPRRWAGPYSSHDLADVLTVLFGCRRALGSLAKAPADLREFVAAWAQSVRDDGGSVFETLIGERPRAFTEGDVEELLRELASLHEPMP